MRAPTCFRLVRCSTRWLRVGCRQRRKLGRYLFGDFDEESATAFPTESERVSRAGRHHPSRAGERQGTALPARSGHAGGFTAAEAGYGFAPFRGRASGRADYEEATRVARRCDGRRNVAGLIAVDRPGTYCQTMPVWRWDSIDVVASVLLAGQFP
jgi:hypothetical protein